MPRWKKGRGALGIFDPLIGGWIAQPEGIATGGRGSCARRFERLWGQGYVRLEADWPQGDGRSYSELAMFGKDREGVLAFWSFTSDGGNAQGRLTDASDIHADAIAFEAEMRAGTARFAYWPPDDDVPGFLFAVESRTKKGWNRFLLHRYRPVA